jgi:predicted RNA-binding protein with PUA-like domain
VATFRVEGRVKRWLFKSEPSAFSFDDLWALKGHRTRWDGLRNYQVRNFLRDEVRAGDEVLFYHSSADPTGVVGVAEIVREAYPDPTQFDAEHPQYDPKSAQADPRWLAVDLRATRRLPRVVTLAEIKSSPRLKALRAVQPGSRLSITPVTEAEWAEVLRLAESPPKRPGKRT